MGPALILLKAGPGRRTAKTSSCGSRVLGLAHLAALTRIKGKQARSIGDRRFAVVRARRLGARRPWEVRI